MTTLNFEMESCISGLTQGDAVLVSGIPIESGAPTDGEILIYDATLGRWVYGPQSGEVGTAASTGATGPTGAAVTGYSSMSLLVGKTLRVGETIPFDTLNSTSANITTSLGSSASFTLKNEGVYLIIITLHVETSHVCFRVKKNNIRIPNFSLCTTSVGCASGCLIITGAARDVTTVAATSSSVTLTGDHNSHVTIIQLA